MSTSVAIAVQLRLTLLTPLILLGALLCGCQREERPDLTPEVDRLKTELEATERKLSATQQTLEAKNDELELAAGASEAVKNQLAEKDVIAAQNDSQIRALQTEIEALKKRDAMVFAEISAQQQQGLSIIALSRYQAFIREFPKSPLAANAASAVAELSAQREREARQRAAVIDPKRPEREVLKNFSDGFATLEELAPFLKKKSAAQVVAFLGQPNQTFNNGAEIGYADKAVNPSTGRRGMLIISFDSGAVSTLRVDYAGRRMTP